MYIVAEDMFRLQLFVLEWVQLSNEKDPGCFGFVGEFTTRLCGDYEINLTIIKVRVFFSWPKCYHH